MNRFISIITCGLLFISMPLLAQEDRSAKDEANKSANDGQVLLIEEPPSPPKTTGFTKNWFIGLKGGATFFLSPLKTNPWSWGAGASLGKQLSPKTAIRFDYLYGNLKSDGEYKMEMADGTQINEKLYSNVDFMEFAMVLKLNMNDFFYSRSPKHLREFYVFGGGAYTMFRNKISNENGDFITGSGYSEEGDEETAENVMAVPLGLESPIS